MNKSIQTRLDHLVEARREQDAAAVKQAVTHFVNGLTPGDLWACRQRPDVCRERLADFLADQPPATLATIERWSARKGER